MTKNSKVDKYINYFLKYVDLKDFWTAFHYLQNKYKLEENYVSLIVEECVHCNYIDGVLVGSNANNGKRITCLRHVYVTRKGYQFLHNYKFNKINFYWIPFKNLIVILITAFITSFITMFVKQISINWSDNSSVHQNQSHQEIDILQE